MYYNQPPTWSTTINKYFLPLLLLGILVNATGLFITILDSDGTLYANIAKTIAVSGDFINLKVSGKDWLDKPHLPFWLAAISYKIVGFTSFAYKLPAFIFWLLGLRYTYLFAKENYHITVAQVAALIYVSSTHLVISNNDVRAEPYLTGMIIGSVYHLHKAYTKTNKWINVFWGSLFAALAIMTKGPFVLITIGGGFVVEWIWKKDWKQFISPIWWICLLLTAIFIVPEIYCLYVQFDLHPEKTVFDTTGVSGIRFFFWDSQFGRFFNNGPIKGEGDYFFFVHTLLWAFLPWCFILYAAFVYKFKKINNRKQEQVTIWASIITLLIFSLSKFQLPHYTNILFPFFAILAANYLYNITSKPLQWISYLQNFVAICMIAVVALLWYFFRPAEVWGIIVWWIVLLAGIVLIKQLKFYERNFINGYWIALCVFAFLNIFFYPALLQYQAGSKAAAFVNKAFPNKKTYSVNRVSYSFSFYCNAPNFDVAETAIDSLLTREKPLLVYADDATLQQLQQKARKVTIAKQFNYFHVSQLNGTFINHKTRSESLIYFNVALVE